MILVFVLAIVCMVGMIAAAAAAAACVRDSPSLMPTVWGYDSRRPLL